MTAKLEQAKQADGGALARALEAGSKVPASKAAKIEEQIAELRHRAPGAASRPQEEGWLSKQLAAASRGAKGGARVSTPPRLGARRERGMNLDERRLFVLLELDEIDDAVVRWCWLRPEMISSPGRICCA
jgi:hypothetical protein